MKIIYRGFQFVCEHNFDEIKERNILEYCFDGIVLRKCNDKYFRYCFCDKCFDELIGLDVIQKHKNEDRNFTNNNYKNYICSNCFKNRNEKNYYLIGFKMKKYYYFCENCWSKMGGDFLMEELERGEIENNVQIK